MKRWQDSKIWLLIIILALTILGGILRFMDFTNNPNSLNIDEVAIGYNAYSILKTGRDEYGIFMPLSFQSVGDYKAPVSVYLMVPSIAFFGLNEFGVRFPNAFLSTLSIPLFFLLVRELLDGFNRDSGQFKNRNIIALISTILFTVSPWDIYYSRYAAEALTAMVFVMAGVLFLLKTIRGSFAALIPASFFLVLSMYTYHSEKLFVPLFVLSLGFIFYQRLQNQKKSVLVFLFLCLVLAIPLVISILFGHDATRAAMTFIGNDIEFNRTVFVDINPNASDFGQFFDNRNFLLFFYWLRKFLFYFHPGYFFYSGLNMTQINTQGLGIVYLFELPFLLFGFWNLLKSKFPYLMPLIFWILLGIIPASLTQNEQHSLRTLLILPAIVFVSGYGAFFFFKWILGFSFYKRILFLSFFTALVVANLIQSFIIFAVHFPTERGEDFMEGTKAAVTYALAHKDEYQLIVFDPYRGIEGPYIVSIPHMYVLFYSKYDPATYQNEVKIQGDNYYGFDKFVIRPVVWSQEHNTQGTLFIASPWSIPPPDVKSDELLDKIFLSNGKLAFIIASPK